jgi:hypothetical protein
MGRPFFVLKSLQISRTLAPFGGHEQRTHLASFLVFESLPFPGRSKLTNLKIHETQQPDQIQSDRADRFGRGEGGLVEKMIPPGSLPAVTFP